MREIRTHVANECNDKVKVAAIDASGSGGANHLYEITVPNGERGNAIIAFQDGPINEVGVNGLTNESLIAIVIDRLQGFQKGQFANRENALALTKLEEAMHWLHQRTRERMARGVEGTHAK